MDVRFSELSRSERRTEALVRFVAFGVHTSNAFAVVNARVIPATVLSWYGSWMADVAVELFAVPLTFVVPLRARSASALFRPPLSRWKEKSVPAVPPTLASQSP